MRWGCLLLALVALLAVVAVVTLAVAGDRICGTDEQGIQAEYKAPFTCETNEASLPG